MHFEDNLSLPAMEPQGTTNAIVHSVDAVDNARNSLDAMRVPFNIPHDTEDILAPPTTAKVIWEQAKDT